MAMATEQRRGVLAGSAAVLRELLRTPRIQRSIEVVLGDLDPENAHRFVDVLMEDPSLPLDLLTSAPAVANAGANATRALLDKVASYPPKLLREFTARVIDSVDGETLGAASGKALSLTIAIGGGDEVRAAMSRLSAGFSRGFHGGADLDGDRAATSRFGEALAEGLLKLSRENPELMADILAPLVDAGQRSLVNDDAKEGATDAG
jgi:hypothetical protein